MPAGGKLGIVVYSSLRQESLSMPKKRSSSRAWLKEHREDPYVQRAHKDGYRSRACYKLLEINDKDRVIRPGMTVLDLGSAPGGWSQIAAELVGSNGRIVASDILPMDSLAGVEFKYAQCVCTYACICHIIEGDCAASAVHINDCVAC